MSAPEFEEPCLCGTDFTCLASEHDAALAPTDTTADEGGAR